MNKSSRGRSSETVKTKAVRRVDWIGFALLLFVLGCRFLTPLADFYSLHCYPVISSVLSLPASVVRFSLEEIAVLLLVFLAVRLIVVSVKQKRGFPFYLKRTVVLIMWAVVWFYIGWGNNYFRTPLYQRAGIERVHFDKEDFIAFLENFTEGLNSTAGSYPELSVEEMESQIKSFYKENNHPLGYTVLRKWQHVKNPLFSPLYSAVSVLGFMGPFFCESQVNLEVPSIEYPSSLAHEMAHLCGVTSEAEANYWSYVFCRQSSDNGVRYSGYLHLLPYVLGNARSLLSEEEYSSWLQKIDKRAIDDYNAFREYWQGKRVKILNDIQYSLMDLMLRSNNVSEGAKDYTGVVSMVITMDSSGRTRNSN